MNFRFKNSNININKNNMYSSHYNTIKKESKYQNSDINLNIKKENNNSISKKDNIISEINVNKILKFK